MNCILQLISYSKEEVIKNSGYDICDVCLWLHTKISLYECNISILVKEWDIVSYDYDILCGYINVTLSTAFGVWNA